ncbi:hypothetical protein JYU19_01375 [bacterium AH-315-J21]|nr:hypothetical protein [bacterium AH-315-J21]
MVFKTNKEDTLNLALLREELWKLEDKVSVVMESEADHEAELIRLKKLFVLVNDRITSIDTRNAIKQKETDEYGN